jgi:uncharacterized coiled-coil protein SlyX
MSRKAIMRQQIEHRLHELKAEWASGQHMLAELEARQTNLRNTLLRISGAIQVLEELLAQAPEDVHPPTGSGGGVGDSNGTDIGGDGRSNASSIA